LAGRIGLIDLTPFTIIEVEKRTDFELNKFWLRGGYPDSYLAQSNEGSILWMENFLWTYIVASGSTSYPIKNNVEVCGLHDFL